jgi:transposase-like protein
MAGSLSLDELFEGRHFDRERGLSMAHTTIMRWVHHYAPVFERRWNRFARPAGSSWRVDEPYVKIRGQWVYLYRAVDRAVPVVSTSIRARAERSGR